MRSYSALLIFETLFDSIPEGNVDLTNFARQLFEPQVTVTSTDCGTTLGQVADVNYELQGRVELSTGLRISRTRIEELLASGMYQVHTRTLSTCTSPGGVCAACYAASRPHDVVPAVNDLATILPLYDIGAEVVSADVEQSTFPITTSSEIYTETSVYVEGQLILPDAYAIADGNITFQEALPAMTSAVIRFTTQSRAPFLSWLSDTYSGALLGTKSLPSDLLPIRSLLLTRQIPESLLESLAQDTAEISSIPPNMLQYLTQIRDKLEKALFLIALRSLYDNVQA